jgi:hypothetical protein
MKTVSIVLLCVVSMALPAFAFDIEEDMAEGMTLSVEKKEQGDEVYKYDSNMDNAEESMTEYVFFPEKKNKAQRFAGDPSCPSGHDLMTEGICLETYLKLTAGL